MLCGLECNSCYEKWREKAVERLQKQQRIWPIDVFSLWWEDSNPFVVIISNKVVAVCSDRDSGGALQLACLTASDAKLQQTFSSRGTEHLHTLAVAVGNEQAPMNNWCRVGAACSCQLTECYTLCHQQYVTLHYSTDITDHYVLTALRVSISIN